MNLSNLWEKIQAHSVTLVFTALAAVVPGMLLFAQEELAAYAGEHPVAVVRVVAGLILTALSSTALLIYHWPRLRFDKRLGIYRDRKTGICYCTSCFAKKVKTPLLEEETAWRCGVRDCRALYENPDYKYRRLHNLVPEEQKLLSRYLTEPYPRTISVIAAAKYWPQAWKRLLGEGLIQLRNHGDELEIMSWVRDCLEQHPDLLKEKEW